jgi:hypothetical protein
MTKLLVSYICVAVTFAFLAAEEYGKEGRVLGRYLELDAGGTRLQSDTASSSEIWKLAMWEDEPGWDTTVIIEKAEIVSETALLPNLKRMEVLYSVLGVLDGEKLKWGRHEEKVEFFLLSSAWGKNRDVGYRIVGPLIPPHVYLEVLAKYYQDLSIDALKANDAQEAAKFRRIAEQLKIGGPQNK